MLTRYEPWNLLNQLHRELERSILQGNSASETSNSAVTAEWTPAVDIKEENDRYVLIADLPGVDPAHVDVMMESGVLTLKGERETEASSKKDAYKRIERIYGSFYRRFSLPDTADAEGISAKCSNGVLEIVIPKKTFAQPKRIAITLDS